MNILETIGLLILALCAISPSIGWMLHKLSQDYPVEKRRFTYSGCEQHERRSKRR